MPTIQELFEINRRQFESALAELDRALGGFSEARDVTRDAFRRAWFSGERAGNYDSHLAHAMSRTLNAVCAVLLKKPPLTNDGVEFEVAGPTGEHLGDLYVTKGGLIWCKGEAGRESGQHVDWARFVAMIEK